MKKKILSVILMLSMLLTPIFLVSCDDEGDSNPPAATPSTPSTPSSSSSGSKPKKMTAKELETQLSNALDKVAAMKSIDFKYDISAEYLIDGSTIKAPITLIMKYVDNDGKEPTTYMSMSMSSMGESYEMVEYHENGWDYVIQNGESYKMESPYTGDDTDDEDDGSGLDSFMTDLSDKNILDMDQLTYENNPDGSRTVKATIDPDKFQEAFADAMEFLDEFSSLGGVGADVSIESSSLEYTIKGGYVTLYKIEFSMKMTVEGEEVTCNMVATAELYNPGKPVTITPPEGYQDFPEYNNSSVTPVNAF